MDELDFDFFTSDKARMLQTGKFDQNVGGYTSLRFSRHNFHDIQRFWELNIKQQEQHFRIHKHWEGWCQTWGVCAARGNFESIRHFQKRKLFGLMVHEQELKIFTDYYKVLGKICTTFRVCISSRQPCFAEHRLLKVKT